MQAIYITIDTESDELYVSDEYTGNAISCPRFRFGNQIKCGVKFSRRGWQLNKESAIQNQTITSVIVGINRRGIYGAGGLLALATLNVNDVQNGFMMGVLNLATQNIEDAFASVGVNEDTLPSMLGVRVADALGIWDSARFDMEIQQPVIPGSGQVDPLTGGSETVIAVSASVENTVTTYTLPARSGVLSGAIYTIVMTAQAEGASVAISPANGDTVNVPAPIILNSVGGVRFRAIDAHGWQIIS